MFQWLLYLPKWTKWIFYSDYKIIPNILYKVNNFKIILHIIFPLVQSFTIFLICLNQRILTLILLWQLEMLVHIHCHQMYCYFQFKDIFPPFAKKCCFYWLSLLSVFISIHCIFHLQSSEWIVFTVLQMHHLDIIVFVKYSLLNPSSSWTVIAADYIIHYFVIILPQMLHLSCLANVIIFLQINIFSLNYNPVFLVWQFRNFLFTSKSFLIQSHTSSKLVLNHY